MSHRKEHHSKFVPICKNVDNNSCQYGTGKCWFRQSEKIDISAHGDDEKIENMEIEENNDKNEMLQLFEMVEKYTERIISLEHELKQSK